MARDDFYASPLGAAYSAYMERPRLSRRIGKAIWGGDTRAYYESMGSIAAMPAGSTIVDCPCGAGPAFRALEPDPRSATSPSTSPRRCSPAPVAGPTSAGSPGSSSSRPPPRALPLEPASADLFVTYWGLHCYPDPRGAIAEIARVLKPGGRVVGATFVRGPSLRQRLLLRPHRGDFGPIPTEEELRGWLREDGLSLTGTGRSGLYMFFEATLDGGSAELGDDQA